MLTPRCDIASHRLESSSKRSPLRKPFRAAANEYTGATQLRKLPARRSPGAGCTALAGRNARFMEMSRFVMVFALGIFLAEGFVLAVFPDRFKEFLLEMEPRSLQVAGLVETVVALGLMAGILAG